MLHGVLHPTPYSRTSLLGQAGNNLFRLHGSQNFPLSCIYVFFILLARHAWLYAGHFRHYLSTILLTGRLVNNIILVLGIFSGGLCWAGGAGRRLAAFLPPPPLPPLRPFSLHSWVYLLLFDFCVFLVRHTWWWRCIATLFVPTWRDWGQFLLFLVHA